MYYLKIEDYVNNIDDILAHINKKGEEETLLEHCNRVKEVFEKISKDVNIPQKINNALEKITLIRNGKEHKISVLGQELIFKMFYNAIYFHDIGKINPKYQKERLKNKRFTNKKINSNMETHHSPLSSMIYIDIFNGIIENHRWMFSVEEYFYLRYVMFCFAALVASHHGDMLPGFTLIERLEKNPDTQKRDEVLKFNKYDYLLYYKKGKLNEDNYGFYIKHLFEFEDDLFLLFNTFELCKFLFSILVTCDSYATHMFKNGYDISELNLGNIDINMCLEEFKKNPIYKGIQKYRSGNIFIFKDVPINELRSKIFIEAETTALNNLDANIYFLESSTGSGKSISAVNLGLNFIKECNLRKMFYIAPFNTILEQTKNAITSYFNGKIEPTVINSITPIKEITNKNGETDYNDTLLNYQMTNYPIILTTNVNLFTWLFGTSRQANYCLFQLCNSVIILDEIQNYKNSIWTEIIQALTAYAEILNIKIIIMSATLPNLEKLTKNKTKNFVDLLPNAKTYFQHPLFKDRVEIDYSLLDKGKITEAILHNKILEEIKKMKEKRKKVNSTTQIKTIVEFIKKDTANSFYNRIKPLEQEGYIVLKITGDDNSYNRRQVIDILNDKNNTKDIILVCTQVIEAGVDIDMDLGFKDYSIFESEEQFMGRVNRSSLRPFCKVFFFSMDNEHEIYKDDIRLNINISKEQYRKILKNKDFETYYNLILTMIERKNNGQKKEGIHNFYKMLKLLDYENVEKHMRLITENTIQVFIPYKIKDNQGNILYDGYRIWDKLKKINEDCNFSYAQKKVELKNLAEEVNLFTYNVYLDEIPNVDYINGIYYIADGEKYIEDGQFDRKSFMENYK